ncbi:MAG: hypothetical protein JWR52_2335 [Marmoricola sp.]|nr:hypothetical protein [Marmoricola sp.]
MTCGECAKNTHEKTLYDKTVARRVATASRRTKRTVASGLTLSLLALGGASTLSPAHAADFSGFQTHAVATPLRIEVHEPAIPIPADPELELNFSYTRVDGSSGPNGSARASAMWPGDGIGEGLKTFGQQLGLPGALTDNGYPVQINAATPGDTASATQEFFPGNTGKVSTSDTMSVAKEGYGTSGDVAQGDSGDGTTPAPTNPLTDITSGNLSALGNLLTGSQTAGPGAPQPSSSPLGALGLLVNAGGMESISSTSYGANLDSVVSQATARLGTISLLAGIVKLDGVEVVAKTTSNIAGGAKTSHSVTIGGMTIAGQKFAFTGTGFVAAGNNTAIPGLPDTAAGALAALGISFNLGKVTDTKTGSSGEVSAEGLRITIKTAPLLSKLPKLPLDQLISQLPDLPGQASILKGLILALGQATPRVDLVLGSVDAQAATVPPISFPGGTGSTGGGVSSPTLPAASSTVPIATGPTSAETPPLAASGTPINSTPINKLSGIPGLPPLGSIPTLLLLAGLLLAAGAGWYLRRAGLLLFGGATTCAHGLKAGIPDLRKV